MARTEARARTGMIGLFLPAEVPQVAEVLRRFRGGDFGDLAVLEGV